MARKKISSKTGKKLSIASTGRSTKLTVENVAALGKRNKEQRKRSVRENIQAGVLIHHINKSLDKLEEVLAKSKTGKSELLSYESPDGKISIKKRNKVDADIIRDQALVHQKIAQTQINARLDLLRKVMPDLKQVELSVDSETMTGFAAIVAELRGKDVNK